MITLNVQNVYRWLTHMYAVACGSLSQRCQWLSLVRQTKLTKVPCLTSIAACIKTPALPPNLIIQWIEAGHLSTAMKSRQSELMKLKT